MADPSDPIADDEILFRRVPVSQGWYSLETGILLPEAFQPHAKNDTTGLSVARKKYKTAKEAAKGRPGKSYFVVKLRAGDLRRLGIAVEPRPLDNDPGHAELPDLNSGNRKTTSTIERQHVLAKNHLGVEGPFVTDA